MIRLRNIPLSLYRRHCRALSVSSHGNYNENNTNQRQKSFNRCVAGFAGVIGGITLYTILDHDHTAHAKEKADKNNDEFRKWHSTERKDLPTYKLDEIQKHCTPEDGIWITYGIGVYDITKFVPKHPGSDQIMLGAGSAIDPFWSIYQQHNTKQVLELLESFRIGNISPDDQVSTNDMGSVWGNEPRRHPLLKPASKQPFNAEPPLHLLAENFITPTEFFYVRNHLPVPVIDEESYELEVEVLSANKTKSFKLKDLKKFPKKTITAAIMCGGNRRSEMNEVKVVKGLSWSGGAVGNARWTGVRLKDVLEKMGVKSDEKKHVIFEGNDLDVTGKSYAASIPLSKAMDERGDVILAFEMNEKTLNRDHGFPIRVIVPGVVGARNVKWLGKIIVSDKESDSHWQQNDYKGFSPSTDWDTVDFTKSPAIQNMPVTSSICTPKPGDKLEVDEKGFVTVKGYAWSGGGNRIVRVDLTIDEGKSWHVAELEQEDLPHGIHWGWSLWSAKIPAASFKGKGVEIWAKAVDSSYNCQPEKFENIWNLRGVLSNAYHRVKVEIKK